VKEYRSRYGRIESEMTTSSSVPKHRPVTNMVVMSLVTAECML
jgi:hypothetical protein